MLNGKNGETSWPSQPKVQNQTKNENSELGRQDPVCSDVPERLQEVGENLVDRRVPERGGSHSSSSQ